MRTRLALVQSLASLTIAGAGACGGGNPIPTTPAAHIVPGGGIADGPIHGALNVFVIDEDTRNVLSSAAVRVGAGDEQDPCQSLTDSTGLARFDAHAAS